VARVLHSEQVAAALSALPTPARSAVEERLEYVQSMPRMYGLTEDERFPGCRTFWVAPSYRVFYMVLAEGNDVYLVALIDEGPD
jgi:mRNA-degrading endonuclease RelE of RelBE toxin-antitoxin system